jgi:hypothetical protein
VFGVLWTFNLRERDFNLFKWNIELFENHVYFAWVWAQG